jgi:hypothetical protein
VRHIRSLHDIAALLAAKHLWIGLITHCLVLDKAEIGCWHDAAILPIELAQHNNKPLYQTVVRVGFRSFSLKTNLLRQHSTSKGAASGAEKSGKVPKMVPDSLPHLASLCTNLHF